MSVHVEPESVFIFGQKHCSRWAGICSANYLLKSPSEIVIDFINRGLPRKERLLFAEDPETRLGIGATWKNIHGRIDRTIPVDIEEIRNYSQTIREF